MVTDFHGGRIAVVNMEGNDGMKEILKFNIELKTLKAIDLFASRDGTRYVLNGVHINIDGVNCDIAATNGCVLGAVRCIVPDQGKAEFIIPSRAIAAVKPRKATGTVTVTLMESESGARMALLEGKDDMAIRARCIEGMFPKWRQVVPTPVSAPHGIAPIYNACYMETLAKAAKLMSPKNTAPAMVMHYVGGDMGPLCVRLSGCEGFIAVVMPMAVSGLKGDVHARHLPEWLRPEPVDSAAKVS